jgi:hypothetical protein
VTFSLPTSSQALIRHDRFAATPTTAIASTINQIRFTYTNYVANADGTVTVTSGLNTASANTGRVTITVTVALPALSGQPATNITLRSDVALRNASYMLTRY